MKRRCLIIAAPGSKTKGTHLPGVSVDQISFRNFLFSDHGGAWEENEVHLLTNPTTGELNKQLELQRRTD